MSDVLTSALPAVAGVARRGIVPTLLTHLHPTAVPAICMCSNTVELVIISIKYFFFF